MIALLLLACVGGDPKETANPECYDLDVASCADDPSCTTLDGREITVPDTGGATCYNVGSPEPLGCLPAGTGCTAVITLATPPGGGEPCYYFTSGCVPEGWVSCDAAFDGMAEC